MVATLQPRPQRFLHDRPGQCPRRVVAAAAAPLLGGLEHQVSGSLGPIEQFAVDPGGQGLQELGFAGGVLQGGGRLGRQGGARLLLQPGLALATRQLQQRIEINRRGELLLRPLGLALEANAADGDAPHRVAHDPLIHRTDLLHIEGPVADPLPLHHQQIAEHGEHHPIADPGGFQPAIGLGIKQLAPCAPAGSPWWRRRPQPPAGRGSSAPPRRHSAAPWCRDNRRRPGEAA